MDIQNTREYKAAKDLERALMIMVGILKGLQNVQGAFTVHCNKI